MIHQILFVIFSFETASSVGNVTIFRVPANSLAKTLQKYENYEIIVHCDNKTNPYLDEYVNKRNDHVPKYILNYDLIEIDFKRPYGRKFLNLIYFDVIPQKFRNYAEFTLSFLSQDVAIVLIDNPEFVNANVVLNLLGLQNIGSLLIYFKNNDVFAAKSFTDVRFEQISHENVTKHINRYEDFNWQELMVGFTTLRPFLWCKRTLKDPLDLCDFDGFEGNILKELGKHHKFRYKTKLFDDQITAWNSMINAVHTKDVDFAIGVITETANRMELVDFTIPFSYAVYEAVYTIRSTKYKTHLMKSFDFVVWTFILIALMSVSCTFIAIYKIMFAGTKNLLIIPIQTCIDQPVVHTQHNPASFSVLFAFMSFTGILISTHYKCGIMSAVISPKTWYPDTIEELVNSGYRFASMGGNNSVLDEAIVASKSPLLATVRKKLLYGLTECNAVRQTLEEPLAYIGEFSPLKTQLLYNCDGKISKNELNLLRITQSRLLPSFHAWPIQRGSRLTYTFSTTIRRMQEGGLFSRWYPTSTNDEVKFANERIKEAYQSLKLSRFLDTFILLGLGYVLSGICLIFELALSKCCLTL